MGNNLGEGEHISALANGHFPSTAFGDYCSFERELVTWPRRGYVQANKVMEYGDKSYRDKLKTLDSHNSISSNGSFYFLNRSAWPFVPLFLQYLLPDRFFDRFLEIYSRRISDERLAGDQ